MYWLLIYLVHCRRMSVSSRRPSISRCYEGNVCYNGKMKEDSFTDFTVVWCRRLKRHRYNEEGALYSS